MSFFNLAHHRLLMRLMIGVTLSINNVVASERDFGGITFDSVGTRIVSSYSGSYALLIGESRYTNGWSNLESIPGELRNVEKVLQSQGFTVEKSFNLNAEELKKRFETFINQYGFDENNRLLFFYSGHGHTRNNKGYIVPVDAANPNFDERAFLQKAVGMNQILSWARRIEAKHVLFLFDSCFSGTVFKAKNLPKMPRQISQAAKEPVRQFITAGSADEVVPAKSVFTPAFIDALRYGWGDLYKDGYVTGEELGLYLKNKVPQHTEQTPQYGKIKDYELSRGDFVFVISGNQVIPQPGTTFQDRLRDGSLGPEMVWIPAGRFRMGDIQGGGDNDEKPVHWVNVKQFAMGKYEVTVGEYLRFVQATNTHAPKWLEKGNEYNIHTGTNNYYKKFGSALTNENHPIVGISWNDAVAYTKWLSQQTGKQYRLPTEAEWEYAARAGTETKYWWGNQIGTNKANCGSGCGDSFKYTAPVGSFAANLFGLFDTVGNVWEWTCSEYEDKYGGKEQDCILSKKHASIRVLRGGSWDNFPVSVRAANRYWFNPDVWYVESGFRVVARTNLTY